MAILSEAVVHAALTDGAGTGNEAADEEAVFLVTRGGDGAWQRPGATPTPGPSPIKGRGDEEEAVAVTPALVEEATAVAAESPAVKEPSPSLQSTVAYDYDHEPGMPVPRSWLMVLAGAVMGGILSIAVYSQAVGSGGNGNLRGFGVPGGGQPQFGQGQNQGAIPNQGGGLQNNQGGLQPNQGGQVRPGAQAQGQANGAGGAAQGQQGNQPPNGGTNALPRPPDITGSIRTISGDSVTLDTPQGTRVVQVDAQTEVFRVDGSSGSASDLTRGVVVAVVASTDPNTRLLRADAIALLR